MTDAVSREAAIAGAYENLLAAVAMRNRPSFDQALDHYTGLRVAEERARVEPLRKFAKWLCDEARNGMSFDGGWLQARAEEMGMLVATYHEKPCDEGCYCAAEYGSAEFPLTCYKDGPLLAAPTTEEARNG